MALRVLDGNQTATTLSSVVTGGEHIVAHSVVSLGANAIANIASAVSGSVVSISNFPSTQTIAGTVTANGDYIGVVDTDTSAPPRGIAIGFLDANQSGNFVAVDNDNPDRHFPVKIGGSLPAISGTVTANANNFGFEPSEDLSVFGKKGIVVGYEDDASGEYRRVRDNQPLPVTINPAGAIPAISGTVTAIAHGINIGGTNAVMPLNIAESEEGFGNGRRLAVSIIASDGVEYGSGGLPLSVSGTVTANASNGSLTTRFGTPTTANIAFATSAVTNTNRKYLLIQNVTTGSNVITVGIGFTPTTTQGIQLTAGAGITFESSYIPTGAVRILSSVTASNFTILEA